MAPNDFNAALTAEMIESEPVARNQQHVVAGGTPFVRRLTIADAGATDTTQSAESRVRLAIDPRSSVSTSGSIGLTR
jgi:hypothetical protein